MGGMTLDRIKEAVQACQRCGLCTGRRNPVSGTGPDRADLMIIGEAPGMTEDALGKPFVGQSGRLLDRLLGEVGLKRSDVFITNIVKCRPPNNRDPEQDEIDACNRYLQAQLKLVQPKVVVTLGKFATQTVLNTMQTMTELRGTVWNEADYLIVPIFHPAYILRNMSKLPIMQQDFALVKNILGGEV